MAGGGVSEKKKTKSFHACAGRPREAVVTPKDVGEPFLGDHAQHLAQPDHDRHRRGEARLVPRRVLPLLAQVEIELGQRGALGCTPRLLAEGEKSQARGQHEPFLGGGDDNVDPPSVHGQLGDAEARDGVDDEDRTGAPRGLRVPAHVVEHARRGLAVLDEHPLHVRVVAQRLGDTIRRHRVAVRRFQLDDGEAEGLADGEPALGERTRVDHDDPVARRQRVGDRRLHGSRSRAGGSEHVLLGLHEALEPLPHLAEERVVFRGAVMDDRTGHREQDIGWHGRRTRRHQLVLLHALLLLRNVCAFRLTLAEALRPRQRRGMISPMTSRTVRTMCPMNCHPTFCGMLVEVSEKGRVLAVKGDLKNPDSRGFLCIRGRAAVEIPHNGRRLAQPLVRDGRRGEDRWRAVSWEEAIDRIVRAIEATSRERVGFWFGHGAHVTGINRPLIMRFGHLGGMQVWNPAIVCWAMGAYGLGITGVIESNTKEDMAAHSRFVLLWGANLASQPTTAPHLMEARRRGARVVLIDVRRTEAARHADETWLIRPGTDAALALAMAHVIVAEGFVDHDFVARQTVGSEAYTEHLKPFTPEWAEGETGLAAADIRRLAREYATSRPAMIVVGGASMYKHRHGWEPGRAIATLPA